VFEILTLIRQKMKTSRDLDHAHLGESLLSRDKHFRVNQCTKFDEFIFSHSREI